MVSEETPFDQRDSRMHGEDVNDINAQMEQSQANRNKSLGPDAPFPKHDSPNSKLFTDYNY